MLATVVEYELWLWDVATGEVRHRIGDHRDAIRDLAFSKDGRWLFTPRDDGSTGVWEVTTGRRHTTLFAFDDGTWAVAPDNFVHALPRRGDAGEVGERDGPDPSTIRGTI